MNSILRNPVERTRFAKFMVVGAFGALVDFGLANFFTHFFGMALVLAGSISFVAAILSNFIWNRYWTYPESRSRPMPHQLGMFSIVNIAGMAIRIPVLHIVEPFLLGIFKGGSSVAGLSVEFVARNMTLALAVGIVMLWNFFVNRHWTYNDVQ